MQVIQQTTTKFKTYIELKSKSMKIMTVVNARVLAIWLFGNFFLSASVQ